LNEKFIELSGIEQDPDEITDFADVVMLQEVEE